MTITLAHEFYEYRYTAKYIRGQWLLSCWCTGPDGYYVAHKSYTNNPVDVDTIDRLFNR